MATKSKLAAEAHPFDGPSFDPLGRNLRKRREESPTVEVIEEQTVEGRRIVLVTRNRT